MKVPGRKISVKTVMTCMERVSCLVLMAMSCILRVHCIIWLLEVCATSWKALDVWMLVCWLRDSNCGGGVKSAPSSVMNRWIQG